MSGLFITASGTGVGKTHLMCALIRALAAERIAARALKPLVTGFVAARPETSDTGRLLAALGRGTDAAALDAVSPWRFAAPLSPDRAAARERRTIDFERLVDFCRPRAADTLTLVEGIGGVMVPLDARRSVLDWIAALRYPAVLVTGSYLGSLSHTLTAALALATRRIELAAVVVSESADAALPLAEQCELLAGFVAPAPVLAWPRGAADTAPGLLATLAGLPGLPSAS